MELGKAELEWILVRVRVDQRVGDLVGILPGEFLWHAPTDSEGSRRVNAGGGRGGVGGDMAGDGRGDRDGFAAARWWSDDCLADDFRIDGAVRFVPRGRADEELSSLIQTIFSSRVEMELKRSVSPMPGSSGMLARSFGRAPSCRSRVSGVSARPVRRKEPRRSSGSSSAVSASFQVPSTQ